MCNYRIVTNPDIDTINEIKNWLREEDQISKKGFYCNWNTIAKSFDTNEIITFHNENSTIGFVVWTSNSIYASIDIFEIHPQHRNKGLGKIFYDKLENFFTNIRLIAVKLFCSPAESQMFWKKLGFIKFPNGIPSEKDLTYFKPLIDICIPSDIDIYEEADFDYKIELWDLEPYEISNQKPKWTWLLKNEDLLSSKPILHPCFYHWNLRWTKNNVIIKEDEVKYLTSKSNSFLNDTFLYIYKLD